MGFLKCYMIFELGVLCGFVLLLFLQGCHKDDDID